MRSVIPYILSFCLPILVIGCGSQQNGETHSLDGNQLMEYVANASKPYILISFYTSSCKPCVKEIPDLMNLSESPDSEIETIFVSVDKQKEMEENLYSFCEDVGINFPPTHFSPRGFETFMQKIHPNWTEEEIPVNLIYTKEGRLVEKLGFADSHEIEMIIHKDQSFRN